MRRLPPVLSIACLLAVSCSSSSTDAPADTGGGTVDSGTDVKADDTADAGVGCGSPPYVTWNAQVQVTTSTGINPAPGAKLTSPLCPGMTFTSGADGKVVIRIARDTPVYGETLLAGAIPASLAEVKLDADLDGAVISLISTDFEGLLPDLATKGYVAPNIDLSGATGECAKDDGISFSIPEDPTAVVSYQDSGGKKIAGATATVAGGSGVIATTPSDTLVHVTVTKAGCTYSPRYPLTGRLKIIKGDVAILNLVVK